MQLHPRHLLLICLAAITWTHAASLAQPAPQEIEANGTKLTYVDQGTGEPIVFVHGSLSDRRVWEPIRETIAARHRFIAPTLRYFGTGAWPDKGEQFGTAHHAADIVAFIRALNVGPVHLVGWSYGANVALAIALDRPDLARSVILFEPALSSLIQEDEAAKDAQRRIFGPVVSALRAGDAEKAMKLLVEGLLEMPPGGFESLPEAVRRMQLDNARTMPLLFSTSPLFVTCDGLKTSNTPVLIVYGGESNAYWRHIAEVMDECLPRGEAAALAGAKHDGPARDPAGFAAMFEGFVTKH
jgi:pimeloyl-ACP methyl ester carboxylesterase